jgi:hypothetical protein
MRPGTCIHFRPESTRCASGVSYLRLAGGGAFLAVLRLPCLAITDRRGEEAQRCDKFNVTPA